MVKDELRTNDRKEPILELKEVSAAYTDGTDQIHGISFEVYRSEVLCIVGESGSGKSTILKSILGEPSTGIRVSSGEVRWKNQPVCGYQERNITIVPQNPSASFNPIRKIEKQLKEIMKSYGLPYSREAALSILEKMELPEGRKILKSRPYQLSGGMNQRVAIAFAMLVEPELLLLDEVTSALDVTTQRQVVRELMRLHEETELAMVMVTHDLALAAEIADRILVMQDGQIVEAGTTEQVMGEPKAEYTKRLIAAVPVMGHRMTEPTTATNALLEVKAAVKRFTDGEQDLGVDHVSMTLQEGEVLGIVGESGSGKSTLLKCIARLRNLTDGDLLLEGTSYRHETPQTISRSMQMIFQNPVGSFDPHLTVGKSIEESMRFHGYKGRKREAQAKILELVREVELDADLLNRKPRELSGGQCQRMAIVRAVACGTKILLCDEITSALDVSVQDQIVRMLVGLKEKMGLSVIFVSHDLALVSGFCDRVMIMKDGRCIEEGRMVDVLQNPKDAYTKELLK